jgi:hypothetical protein
MRSCSAILMADLPSVVMAERAEPPEWTFSHAQP